MDVNHRMSFIFVDPVFDIDIISSLGSVAELPSWGRTGFDGETVNARMQWSGKP